MEQITIISDWDSIEDWEKNNIFDLEEKEKEKKEETKLEPEKLNFLGLTKKESELVSVIFFGGLYVILFVSGMMMYTEWYFNK